MSKNILNRAVLIGLALLALLLIVNWGSSVYANSTDEIKQNSEVRQHNHDVRVDPHLLAEIKESGSAGYLIYFAEKADLSPAYNMDWEARGHFVVDTLQATAEASQKNVHVYLDGAGVVYKPFWIDNVIVVEQSNSLTLEGLLAFPEIASIIAAPDVFLFEPVEAEEALANTIQAVESNISRVNAPDVWNMGITGQGITVASIDSGVRYTHEALVNQYRGNLGGNNFNHNYHWWNPYAASSAPFDSDDHGSHVTGTMVGDDGGTNQIGMAPGANWIACMGFNPSATNAGLLECGQFMLAPWDLNGENPNPDVRPHVVNNSWGSCGNPTTYDGWYQGTVDAWVAAGIYPVFANGNRRTPPFGDCPVQLESVGNPARYGNVTGVGALGRDNGLLADYSLWGPSDVEDMINPRGYSFQKPQVSAPGTNRSAGRNSDTHYLDMSGTSMASPHVAGLIALIWEAAPCLIGEYGLTETVIEETAVPADVGSDYPGHPNDGPAGVPNQATGWGEIDALAAVQQAQSLCGPTGTLTGTVAEDGSGDPLPGATIEVTISLTETQSATAGSSGTYTITFVPEGSYDVTASLFGYLPQTVSNVDIISGTVTTQDFALAQAPNHTVSGVVTDNTTGWPLYASITIAGAEMDPIWTDPADGSYSVVLPEAITYTFHVNTWVGGYQTASREVGPLVGDQTEDFGLLVDAVSCIAPGYSPGVPTNVYSEDFNADDGAYVSAGTNDDWEWGAPVSWPGNCTSGDNCWGTNLDGNYSNSADMTLTSPVIDLSAYPNTPLIVTWQQANHIESATWDQGYAEVSIDGGPWLTMWEHTGPTSQVDWRELSYDLSAAAGTDAQFRWQLVTDSSVNYNGIFIDGVAISMPSCVPAAGGLVVGNVYDNNTDDSLIGAMVSSDDDSTTTAATPADPDVDDGFYTIFAPAGSTVITATMMGGYADGLETLNIVDGTTTAHNFYLDAGWLTTDPTAFDLTLELGNSTTVPLTLTNNGNVALNYNLLVANLSEDFEEAVPPHSWTVVNNSGDCVWQRNDEWPRPNYAGGDGFSAAADSDACGSGTTMNTELHTPVLDLSGATVASLEFVASYRHLGSSSFQVHVSDDGGSSWDTLLTWTASVDPTGPGAPVSLDLTPYVGSSNVIVSFHYVSGWDWWAQVDQVRVLADTGPWLSFDPATGSVGDNSDESVDVTVDTSDLPEPGIYSALIQVEEDTPYSVSAITATLTVTAPPWLALLEGTVMSTGYCGTNPAPAVGAEVVITSGTNSWTVYTDADGYYYQYIDESYSPVDITVMAPDHEADSVTGVGLTGQQTTTEDFALRLLAPCVSVAPEAFDVEIGLGTMAAYTLVISNTGGGAAEVELRPRPAAVTTVRTTIQPAIDIAADARSAANGTPGISSPVYTPSPHSILLEEGFEDGVVPPPGWTHVESNVAFSWKLQTSNPHQGSYAADVEYDPALVPQDEWLISPELMLVEGTLSFWSMGSIFWCRDDNDNCDLNVWLVVGETPGPGDIFLGRANDDWTDNFVWSQSAFDLTPHLPGSPVRIGFQYEGVDGAQVVLDAIVLEGVAGELNVPWLSTDPVTGTVAADSTITINVIFDTTVLTQTGTYNAVLRVLSNDQNGPIDVPVTMRVTTRYLYLPVISRE